MERLNPRARRDAYGSKLNRGHSPILAIGLPWLTIVLASLTPLLPFIASAPLMPPFGYLMFLAWRLARPGLLPVWAGIPLGAFDDLFSGQPLGSAIMLWSLSMLAIEIIEIRFKWRAFWQDWAIAGVMITLYVLAAAPIARFALTPQHLAVMAPQIVFSILLFPVIARLVARLDRARLSRVRTLN